MKNRASIAMFQKSTETEDETQPITPSEVFEAAKEVEKTKQTKVVRNSRGVFVITYSESGPFNEPHLASEWMPIQVYVLKQWSSGGIRLQEMEAYDENYYSADKPSHE